MLRSSASVRRSHLKALGLGLVAGLSIAATSAPAAESTPPLCGLLGDADAKLLMTKLDVEVRAQAKRTSASESVCTWSATQRGLAAHTPPNARLVLKRLDMGSADRAQAKMQEAHRLGTVLRLARTEDADDEQVDLSGDRFAARHGALVAIADGSGANEIARAAPDWRFRLQCLALRGAGAAVLGPADARATADACHLVDGRRILPLMTLSPSRLRATPDGAKRCMFSVEDGSGLPRIAVYNSGSGDLRISDLGSNAAALKFQHQQTPFLPASTAVRTVDPGDRVMVSADRPDEVWAVHGPYNVELDFTDETPAAKTHPTWGYRVQRAALEAAGATVIPAAGMAPDPVIAPGLNQTHAGAKTMNWSPPPHAPPPGAALLEPFAEFAAFLSHYRFFVLPACIVLPVFFSVWWSGRMKARGYVSRSWILPMLTIPFGIVCLVAGPALSSAFIYSIGRSASAVITGAYDTGSQYNNQRIVGRHVLIRAGVGRVISARFTSDQFNVYPSHNETVYPSEGEPFTVRYLAQFPQTFVIVGDDASPFAKAQRCGDLESRVNEAQRELSFANDVARFRAAYDDARRIADRAGCDRE